MSDVVSYTEDGDVAVVTIDDGRVNALSPDTIAAVDEHLGRAETDGKAVVLAGRPGRFSAGFDLSVITGVRTLAADVQAVCAAAAGPHSLGVQYLYAYAGEKLGEGRKSLTFRTTLGADDRTLTGAEVSAVRAGIIGALEGAGYTVQA